MRKIPFTLLSLLCAAIVFINACSKGGGSNTPADPCAGVTVAVTATITSTTNPTTSNGIITASATGGSGFTYSLNNGSFQGSGTFSGLANGQYTVAAKNSNGCLGSASFTVASVPCPTIVVDGTTTPATSATSNNGAINATATGSAGLTYSITGVNGTYQATGNFTNLAGNLPYTVFAKDVNGCTGFKQFTVGLVSCPTISITTTNTPATGPTAANGSFTATAANGVAPYMYSRDITAVNFQTSGTFSGLTPGNYNVIAKDANGCVSAPFPVTIGTNCPNIVVSGNTTPTVKCEPNTGTLTVTATGSTGFTFANSPNLTAFQPANVFGSLAAGSYTFIAKDANSCTGTNVATVQQAAAGPLFTQVKAILQANCGGCHGATNPTAGINLTDDCIIVAQKNRVKARAVDFNPSVMPPSGAISAADRQKITDWINAGGRHNN
jgi:mono/diheme cytochrome c family protein